ncbi:hypothetical protein [Bowmanella denitrificans]|uniref:hypothetical protein n=1 Tax=Bowmanella denitrificans TaxID=366582 RepID=UPI000C9B39E2|nr:hypothetical protein [Bowmanella denitrificans]
MKRVLMCLSVMIPSVGYCCPSLDGTWTSSIEKFESFNKKWANIEDKAWSFMIQTQGIEVIKYNGENKMSINSPEIEIKVGEKKMKRPPSEERITFNVLGCTSKSIAMQYERYGEKKISQLHFENEDTYWVYMGSAGTDGNSHIREYYTRNKSN